MKKVLWFSLSLATLSLSACGSKNVEPDYASKVNGSYGVTQMESNGRVVILPQTGVGAGLAITRTGINTVKVFHTLTANFKTVAERTDENVSVGKAQEGVYSLSLNGKIIGQVTDYGRAEIETTTGYGRWYASRN